MIEPKRSTEPAVPAPREVVETLPALARSAAGLWLRAAAWGLGTSLRVGAQLARAATDPDRAVVELYSELADGVRAYAREFLGITDLDDRMRTLSGSSRRGAGHTELDLRARGAELLRQAADVGFDESAHPAYARILTELAPDEARILRLLAEHGPQPLVDVRAGNLIGIGSQLIAQNLNMLDAYDGLRRRDRVPAYIDNLTRLGLVALLGESLGGPAVYQVLEAQPDVLGLLKETPRGKTVHRSICLSAFGRDFCEVCLPFDRAPAGPADVPAPVPEPEPATEEDGAAIDLAELR